MTRPVAPLPPAKAERMPLDLDTRGAVDMGMMLAGICNMLQESINPAGSRRRRDHLARLALHELRSIELRLLMIGTMPEREACYKEWQPIDENHPAVIGPKGES